MPLIILRQRNAELRDTMSYIIFQINESKMLAKVRLQHVLLNCHTKNGGSYKTKGFKVYKPGHIARESTAQVRRYQSYALLFKLNLLSKNSMH